MTTKRRDAGESAQEHLARSQVALLVMGARKRMGISSQEKLAEEAGVSRATIARVELGLVTPSIPTSRGLAKALGLRLGDLRPDIAGAA